MRGRFKPATVGVSVAALLLATAFVYLIRPPEPLPQVAAELPSGPAEIRLIVDASASMAGYFAGKTKFKDFLAGLIAHLPTSLESSGSGKPAVTYAFARDAGQKFQAFEGDSQQLIGDVLNSRLQLGGSSMLQEAVDQIRDEMSTGRVDLLLTDGIVSYPNNAVKADPEINRNNLEGLAAQIQMAFLDPKWAESGIHPALAVLQYSSEFRGLYYDYRNVRHPACCGADRPFYLWIVGDVAHVGGVLRSLQAEGPLQPVRSVLMGAGTLDGRPRVLNFSNRTGKWSRDRRDKLRLNGLRPSAKEPEMFTLALDLSAWPIDQLGPDHLLSRLSLHGDFVKASVSAVMSRVQFAEKGLMHAEDVAELSGATHFLTLEALELSLDQVELEIRLGDQLPDWVFNSSTTDDSDVDASVIQRTFGLGPILNGAHRALSRNQPLLQIKVLLNR